MKYKSWNLTRNVHPNVTMLALHDLLNTPFYKNADVSIHPQWFDIHDDDVHDTYENNNNGPFEEEQKNSVMNTMVQNILVPN